MLLDQMFQVMLGNNKETLIGIVFLGLHVCFNKQGQIINLWEESPLVGLSLTPLMPLKLGLDCI